MYAVPATRNAAKNECEYIQGGSLASILTLRDRHFLLEYWNEILPAARTIWTGLKRNPENRDEFLWDNGDGIQFTDWITGEPNDINEREDCVEFIKGEGWNDRECYTRKYPFICMKSRI
ncbi:Macrophage mannose receptor 1 [Holothuria leucospilota]|uniref:Macrophage mannose receptor 1 n=1 Tax=Holothuria leucospilota TaxID=206669 RepID=A0A9Q1BYE5_HOLLE|nr:Macrophage mannose receptor 1 [Holothuria leucospilota]